MTAQGAQIQGQLRRAPQKPRWLRRGAAGGLSRAHRHHQFRLRRLGHRCRAGKDHRRGPQGGRGHPGLAPPSPRRAEKGQGGHPLQARHRLHPRRRSAHRDRRTGRGRLQWRDRSGAARRHRLGQDLHRRPGDRPDQPPRADPRAQQDPGRPALWRVQELLPRKRGRILRLLLRLLPARGLRPAHRHLYRKGIHHQRADRPDAPLGHPRDPRARRRDHRRLGVLHLRHRLGGGLHHHDHLARKGPEDRPARTAQRTRRPAIQARRHRLCARHVPRARRHDRDLPRPL